MYLCFVFNDVEMFMRTSWQFKKFVISMRLSETLLSNGKESLFSVPHMMLNPLLSLLLYVGSKASAKGRGWGEFKINHHLSSRGFSGSDSWTMYMQILTTVVAVTLELVHWDCCMLKGNQSLSLSSL